MLVLVNFFVSRLNLFYILRCAIYGCHNQSCASQSLFDVAHDFETAKGAAALPIWEGLSSFLAPHGGVGFLEIDAAPGWRGDCRGSAQRTHAKAGAGG